MILGGIIQKKTSSVVGPDAIKMISELHADIYFLGTNAFDVNRGLMTPNRMEAEIKKSLISISDSVILLADSSKIRKRALFHFCPPENIDIFITDSGIDKEFINEISKYNIKTIIV